MEPETSNTHTKSRGFLVDRTAAFSYFKSMEAKNCEWARWCVSLFSGLHPATTDMLLSGSAGIPTEALSGPTLTTGTRGSSNSGAAMPGLVEEPRAPPEGLERVGAAGDDPKKLPNIADLCCTGTAAGGGAGAAALK